MQRIQQLRGVKAKGWRKPAGAISVTRQHSKRGCPVGTPNYWGNEYTVKEYGREQAIALYRHDIEQMDSTARRQWLAPLHKASCLMCYCSLSEPCHADVLFEWLAKV